MEQVNCSGSAQNLLSELNAAADSLIFRWSLSIGENLQFYNADTKSSVKNIICKVNSFFQGIENGEIPDSPLSGRK